VYVCVACRDVKTTNILVSRDWRAKLCDFSFACHGDTASKHEYIYGTDEFMAPEIALGEDFNIAADMFSYGIVLCEMICGKEPSGSFLKRSPRDLFALNEAELRQSVMPGCPESLEALTLQCCSREPDSRTSAEECVMWLEVGLRIPTYVMMKMSILTYQPTYVIMTT
jgi:serine/threonine protein kinase